MKHERRGVVSFWPMAAVAAIGLNVFTTLQYQTAGDRLVKAESARDSLASEVKVLTSERRGLIGLLREVDVQSSPLRGSIVDSVGLRDSIVASPALVYTIAPKCPVCAVNLPFLNSVASEAPGSVIGISLASAEETLSYISANRIQFPVLVEPVGGAMRVLPRHATPVLLVMADSRLATFFSGQLTPAEQSFVRSAAAELAGSRQQGAVDSLTMEASR